MSEEPKFAEQQVSASQLMAEAYEKRQKPVQPAKIQIQDLEELREYQGRKRTEYEKALRVKRFDFGQWMRYAQFEIDQKDYARARSIFERALEVDHKQVPLWIRYIQTELKGKNINHARNLLDRATRLLPRVDKLWYQYVTVEESVGDVVGTRQIFENWLQWKPGPEVWEHYIRFETRYNEFENARLLFEKFVVMHPSSATWLQWAEFEKEHGDEVNVRNVYRLGVEALRQRGALDAKIIYSWIQFEISKKNWEQAKLLFDYGFEHLSEEEKVELRADYTQFEKQHGQKDSIETSVVGKRMAVYEQELARKPDDYDTWWVYLKLVEPILDEKKYERKLKEATDTVPSSALKSGWLSYIYLWMKYLIWSEKRDLEKTRELYRRLISLIPHKKFTFSRIWAMYAEFEVRHGQLAAARKVLGRSIGLCGDVKAMKYYIELETQLREFDRVRMVYTKLVELHPRDSSNWIDFASLEAELGDRARCVAIYELAAEEDSLSLNEKKKVLEAYYEYEMEERNYDNARKIRDRIVQLSDGDARSLVQRCLMELKVPTQQQVDEFVRQLKETGDDEFQFEITQEAKDRCRDVFNRTIDTIDTTDGGAKKKQMIDALISFERKHGTDAQVAAAEARLPRMERRFRQNANGEEEEYYEFVFDSPEPARASGLSRFEE
ncbi:hypothetical protein KL949_002490 [Ogataea haglerorum]|nr:hypothetical protein KL913_004167 [Ogataea haglerorum]KAG7719498.1 hypothetical protein KL949_002490 [Ogataea haglerorum]